MKKLFLIFIIPLQVFSSYSQNVFPTDWQIDRLKGNPKKIIELTKLPEQDHKTKDVNYFNEHGYLTKIEHYNLYDKDLDSLFLNDITYFHYFDENTKFAYTLNHESGDTIRVKSYQLIEKRQIKIQSIERTNSFYSIVHQKLDSNYGIIEVQSLVTDSESGVQKINSTSTFNYIDNQLFELTIINNRTPAEGVITKVNTLKIDEKGNFLSREYYNENEKLVYIVNRIYTY